MIILSLFSQYLAYALFFICLIVKILIMPIVMVVDTLLFFILTALEQRQLEKLMI